VREEMRRLFQTLRASNEQRKESPHGS
jgi:hypothetical protein